MGARVIFSRRVTRQGFTLIELLISISLSSLILITAAYAYNFFQENWRRSMGKFETAVENYQRWQIVLDVINASQVKTVYRNQPVARSSENNTGFYFLGEEGGFTAYSAISVQDPARTSVYRLFKEEDPFNQGKWRLVYEEAMLIDQLLRSADQTLPFNFRRILQNNLDEIEFFYYGFASLEDRNSGKSENASEVINPSWYKSYDGMTINLNPLSVKIRLEQQVIFITIPDTLDRSIMSVYSDV